MPSVSQCLRVNIKPREAQETQRKDLWSQYLHLNIQEKEEFYMRTFHRSFLLFALLMLLGISPSFAQWAKITPFGFGAGFYSITTMPNGTSGTNLFVAEGASVYRSKDNGSTWDNLTIGLSNSGGVNALAVSGGDLFAATEIGGVYLSTDTGETWVAVSNGLPRSQYDSAQCYPIPGMIVSGNNIFVGTQEGTVGPNGGVYLSTNNGTSWTPAGLSNTIQVSSFSVSGTDLLAATDDGVYSSANNGQSWAQMNTGMAPDTFVQSVAFVPNGTGGTNLFAGIIMNQEYDSYGGVFISSNGGASWSAVDSGMVPFPYTNNYFWTITSFATAGSNVFAGANGGGLYLFPPIRAPYGQKLKTD